MDPENRVREKKDEVLPNAFEYFLQGSLTSEEVYRKIHRANREYDKLLTLVKKQTLRRFGQV